MKTGEDWGMEDEFTSNINGNNVIIPVVTTIHPT
jgi:hypothetical protein